MYRGASSPVRCPRWPVWHTAHKVTSSSDNPHSRPAHGLYSSTCTRSLYMAASPRFLFIAVIFCHGVAGGDVSDSKCSVQVLQFWREVEALIKGPACRGLSNARVCSADAFSSLLGDEDAGKVRGWRGRAITPQTRTPPTPWLTIGNFAFTGNSYLDFLVYTLFFRDVRRKRPLTYVETGGSNGVHALKKKSTFSSAGRACSSSPRAARYASSP